MSQLTHVKNFIYQQPWLLPEEYLNAYVEILENHFAGLPNAKAAAMDYTPPAVETVNGVDVIRVMGPIIPRANLFSQISGATSIDVLSKQFAESIANPNSVCTMLYFDSPGGSVQGIFEFSDQVRQAATDPKVKKVEAFIEGQCCSAAYCIASQCEGIHATRGSMLGSIGVVAKLSSTDRMERNAGVDSTVIASHELKAAGSSTLTPNQESMIRRKVMQCFEMFKDCVIRARADSIGDINPLATGEVFMADECLKNGLCDSITTFDSIIKEKGFRQF